MALIETNLRTAESGDNSALIASWARVAPSIVCPQPRGLAKLFESQQLGLFATRAIACGEFLGEYTGDVYCTQDLFENPDLNTTHMLLLGQADPPFIVINGEETSTLNRVMIDGKNPLRYANHSRTNPNAQCLPQTPLFFALRDIAEGEEITWRYGDFDFPG